MKLSNGYCVCKKGYFQNDMGRCSKCKDDGCEICKAQGRGMCVRCLDSGSIVVEGQCVNCSREWRKYPDQCSNVSRKCGYNKPAKNPNRKKSNKKRNYKLSLDYLKPCWNRFKAKKMYPAFKRCFGVKVGNLKEDTDFETVYNFEENSGELNIEVNFMTTVVASSSVVIFTNDAGAFSDLQNTENMVENVSLTSFADQYALEQTTAAEE